MRAFRADFATIIQKWSSETAIFLKVERINYQGLKCVCLPSRIFENFENYDPIDIFMLYKFHPTNNHDNLRLLVEVINFQIALL